MEETVRSFEFRRKWRRGWGQEHVRNNFLITRQIRDYLSVWFSMENKGKSVLEL